MKKIELTAGIHSSVLGFGCAPILGAVDGKKAERAIACAMDCGINHFDLARSYGYGEAERFVGKAIGAKRSDVVLASKFGIKANFKARLLGPLKPLIRSVLKFKDQRKAPEQAKITKSTSVADRLLYRIPLNGKEMRKSLEQSLSSLMTDYLDYFFIHEPLETIDRIDEVLRLADDLKKEGKIRAFGLAYMKSQEHLHQAYLDKFDVLQFNNSPGINGYQSIVKERGQQPNIFFSPINGGNQKLSPAEKLKILNNDFPSSIILCAMFNEKHLLSNASLFK